MDQRYHHITPLHPGVRRALRVILPVILLLALCAGAHAQPSFFRVLAPAGGENLVVDSTVAIRWVAPQTISGKIVVEYSADSGAVWKLIDTVAARAGFDTLFWKVPNDTTRKAFVRLTALDSQRVARSQRVFNIVLVPVPTLRVIYPNGGETFGFDSTASIIWTGSNLSGQLQVQYSIDSGMTWKNIAMKAARSGLDTLSWTIPHDSTTKGMVRVRRDDSSLGDASNRTFTIKSTVKPTIILHYPNGGEIFTADSTVRIKWTAQDVTGPLAVEYSADNGATWKPVGTRQARAGLDSITWMVPNDSTTSALVRVGPALGVKDTSDAVFTIKGRDSVPPPQPEIELLYPNGGEKFRTDSTIQIRWRSADISGRIDIQYSTNAGGFWYLIDAADARPGVDSLAWTIPNATTKNAMIRIVAGNISDTTNARFSINEPITGVPDDRSSDRSALHLIGAYPNPAAGATTIRWRQDAPGDVELRLYDNKGSGVATIDAGYRTRGEQELLVQLGSLPAGAYHFELRTAQGFVTGSVSLVR